MVDRPHYTTIIDVVDAGTLRVLMVDVIDRATCRVNIYIYIYIYIHNNVTTGSKIKSNNI
jgi:hypothetical protein